jgi:dTMP kinase
MGYIIVIDGTDGCGKQTQSTALFNRLIAEGYKAKLQSFPNYDSPSASPVKMYLGGEFGSASSMDAYQASVLYAVDRMCTYMKDLKEFYESGGVIVMDRYVQANMLHQACKIGDKSEVDKFLEWLEKLEFGDLKLPRADKVIFLDVPVEVSRRLMEERGVHKSSTTRDVHEENIDHLKRAYESGKYCSEKLGWNTIECSIDGKMKSIEEISSLIWDVVALDIEKLK